MDDEFPLSEDEYQSAEAILGSYLQETNIPGGTLDNLVYSWLDFVERVDNGYGATLNDYANDLDGRQMLSDLLPRLPDPIRLKLAELLRPWDELFLTYTLETREAVFPPLTGAKTSTHWYYRVPKKLKFSPGDYDWPEWAPYYGPSE